MNSWEEIKSARRKAAQIIFDYEHSDSYFETDGEAAEEFKKCEYRANFLPDAILDYVNATKG